MSMLEPNLEEHADKESINQNTEITTATENKLVAASPRIIQKNILIAWALAILMLVVSAGLAGIAWKQHEELQFLRDRVTIEKKDKAIDQTTKAKNTLDRNIPEPLKDPKLLEIAHQLPRRLANDPRAQGKKDAPVLLMVWSDFRCPFCSQWAREAMPKLKPYVDSGSLRIEYHDLVLFGQQSLDTAVAARAAGLQGKYWEFSHEVHKAAPFGGHPNITEADNISFAEKAGVTDMAKFKADIKSPVLKKAVTEESVKAQNIGFDGTPTFIVNDTFFSGLLPKGQLFKIIESYGGKK